LPVWALSLLVFVYGLLPAGPRDVPGWLLVVVTALLAYRHERHVSLYALVWLGHVPPEGRHLVLGPACPRGVGGAPVVHPLAPRARHPRGRAPCRRRATLGGRGRQRRRERHPSRRRRRVPARPRLPRPRDDAVRAGRVRHVEALPRGTREPRFALRGRVPTGA